MINVPKDESLDELLKKVPKGSWELQWLAFDGEKRSARFQAFCDDACEFITGYGSTPQEAVRNALK